MRYAAGDWSWQIDVPMHDAEFLGYDRDARVANERRIREFSTEQANALRIFCAHDEIEFQELAGG